MEAVYEIVPEFLLNFCRPDSQIPWESSFGSTFSDDFMSVFVAVGLEDGRGLVTR